MIRRTFLSIGLMLVGLKRRAWAQFTPAATRYHPLTKPVRIPVDAVTTPWHLAPFTAEAMARGPGQTVRRVLISGALFRRQPANKHSELSALCLTCPHEQCQVDLITDPARLATMSGTTRHPMFLCGCHASVFDALDDGAAVAGPTPRGLYRFRVRLADDGAVEISEVEEAALSEV